jgi:hypothetical protein
MFCCVLVFIVGCFAISAEYVLQQDCKKEIEELRNKGKELRTLIQIHSKILSMFSSSGNKLYPLVV